jgi:preprotein translocase subunit SecF
MTELRSRLGGLGLGEVTLQAIGGEAGGRGQDLLVRLQQPPGGPDAQQHALTAVTAALQPGFEIRRTEAIGPQVSAELLRDAVFASVLAVLALLIFSGPVLRNFSLALVWGLVVGTYSSIFVASSLLLHLPSLRRSGADPDAAAIEGKVHSEHHPGQGSELRDLS